MNRRAAAVTDLERLPVLYLSVISRLLGSGDA